MTSALGERASVLVLGGDPGLAEDIEARFGSEGGSEFGALVEHEDRGTLTQRGSHNDKWYSVP